ncbi:DUF4355 domain-containing protein [Ornithinibacillus bavariensis]|uniref:DUF4355 domain-containing protein n=1 Tax=Ornithinibacillus bavariensis TaxID=545502 RepID=UPI003D1EDC32
MKNKLEKMKNVIDSKKLKFPEPLKLNLQFFAESGDPQDPPADPPADPPTDPKKLELTEEELQRKIESESDRKLASALSKKQQEWDAQLQTKIDEAIKEQKRLSKLSEEERKNEELEQREKDLQKRLAELERKELRADAVADLKEKGLPSEFADFLLAENAEKTLENINSLKKTFDDAVNAKVKEALRQDTPPAGGSSLTNKNPFSKEHFNLTEQGRLLRENPELYKKLKAEANK